MSFAISWNEGSCMMVQLINNIGNLYTINTCALTSEIKLITDKHIQNGCALNLILFAPCMAAVMAANIITNL